MEVFLLSLLALLRPMSFIEIDAQIVGLKLFEIAAIGLTGLLVGAWMIRATVHKDVGFSALDLLILAFVFWCVAAYIIYIDNGNIAELAKLILPLLTFTIARNLIRDRQTYETIIFLMIVGFVIPITASAVLSALGKGLTDVSYWTGIPRYGGVYSGDHNLGHNAAFVIMLMALYARLTTNGNSVGLKVGKKALFLILGAAALYCLYAARVRTSLLGLLVFFAVYLAYTNKKVLVFGMVASAIVGAALAPKLVPHFFHDVAKVQAGEWDISKLGSNRPNIWMHNIEEYAALSLDQQLAGGGIGTPGMEPMSDAPANFRDSHSDFLEVLVQTGLVGFGLFTTIWFMLFLSIYRLPIEERYIFLALFAAVTVMNLVSNSYVSRFGLGQMFYLALAYLGLQSRQEASTKAATAG